MFTKYRTTINAHDFNAFEVLSDVFSLKVNLEPNITPGFLILEHLSSL